MQSELKCSAGREEEVVLDRKFCVSAEESVTTFSFFKLKNFGVSAV